MEKIDVANTGNYLDNGNGYRTKKDVRNGNRVCGISNNENGA